MRRLMLLSAGLACSGFAHGQLTGFSEKTVAGTPSDLMIVRHLVLRGDNAAIGKKLAEIAKREAHGALLRARRKEIHQKELAWFRVNYPERVERAMGVAQAYGMSLNSGYDFTSVAIDLPSRPGCSVVYYPPSSVTNHHAMLSRNYDFRKGSYKELTTGRPDPGGRSMTGDPYVIEMHPNRGYASLYTCAYDIVGGAIDGVNSQGVSVALLADDMSKVRTRGTVGFGLSEVDTPRYVLDRCRSARQARALLKKIPYYCTFTPCHYIIGDATGDSFIFEVGANGKHYIIDGGGKPQVVTNHSIAEYGTKNLPSGNSFDRYRRLQAEIAKRKSRVTPAQVKEINYCAAVPSEERVAATMWHAVYDLTDRSVKISFCLSRADEAKERRTPYFTFRLARG